MLVSCPGRMLCASCHHEARREVWEGMSGRRERCRPGLREASEIKPLRPHPSFSTTSRDSTLEPFSSAPTWHRGNSYRVRGDATTSGKPYIGRHKGPEPQKTRSSRDGRDRTQAEVIDDYNPENVMEVRIKEQQAIDDAGGVPALDNKRNEIAPDKRGGG